MKHGPKIKALIIGILISFSLGFISNQVFLNKMTLEKERIKAEKNTTEILSKLDKLNDNIMVEFEIARRNSFHFVMNTLMRKCLEKNIPINNALSLIQIESNFDPNAVSWTGDHGLFQFNLSIWKKELDIDEAKLYDPEYNIEIGLTIFKRCYDKAGNWPMAAAIYNRGNNYVLSGHAVKLTRSQFQ